MSGWYGSPVVAVELGQVRPAAAITTTTTTTTTYQLNYLKKGGY